MLYPEAVAKPVQNHGGPLIGIKGLVLHVQQGNGSLYGYFNNPTSQVSAHFWISKAGEIEQYLDTNQVAWAEAAGNPYYLSIETEGFDTEALTGAQMQGIAGLLIWMNKTFSVPLVGPVAHGNDGFTQHCNPDGTPDPAWGNHTCPGPIRLGQMPQILALTAPPTIEGAVYMDSVVAPNGDIVSHYRTPENHLLEVTRKAGKQGNAPTDGVSVQDFTAQWPQFEVAG